MFAQRDDGLRASYNISLLIAKSGNRILSEKNIPKSGRKRILDDEQKLDILLDIQDNPHKPTRQVAADNDKYLYLANRFRSGTLRVIHIPSVIVEKNVCLPGYASIIS
ncbi:hypothetical protein NQ318_010386 [Aromia moschata]|uniref:Uncharacterized protein n=1 Tax=Aromia moschata TaxID=1265417 RepID=A0AAV8Y3T4_9CUCU|nr:hypothetical protein NQ318_010386 [Aromia moschata]